MRGYKIFNADWTCRGKQYSCPGEFEENVEPKVGESGMHFCGNAIDCFNYYSFSPKNHVAEIEAYGEISENTISKCCCSNKIRIIREVPWSVLLELVNVGENCTGFKNTGNMNSGNFNTGIGNSGSHNTGVKNWGSWNSGHRNFGCGNAGSRNFGQRNTGDNNTGNKNAGDWNSGSYNAGNHNAGNYNTGDWNATNCSSGCFNTQEQHVYFFNKQSNWTLSEWYQSKAHEILEKMPLNHFECITFYNMTDDEKAMHPEAATTGSFLRLVAATNTERQNWWDSLSKREQQKVVSIPNFDPAIFKKITGITV